MLGQSHILSILKFFPIPEAVAQTGQRFQYRDHFVIASRCFSPLLFSVNMHKWEQIYTIHYSYLHLAIEIAKAVFAF